MKKRYFDEIKNSAENIEGWLTNREGSFLYQAAKSVSGRGVVVEIGSWKGKSTVWLAGGSKAGKKTKVYAIDPHAQTSLHTELQQQSTLEEFTKNLDTAGLSDLVKPIVHTSEKAVSKWNKPIELLFIDGAHDYESVKADFFFWSPFVVDGGIIAFHDTTCAMRYCLSPYHMFIKKYRMTGWPEVRKAAHEVIFNRNGFKNVGLADSILYATKTGNPTRWDRMRTKLTRMRKTAPDLLQDFIFFVFRTLILNKKDRK